MSQIFNLSSIHPDKLADLETLSRLALSPIQISTRVIVVVEDDELVPIVRRVLDGVISDPVSGLPVSGTVESVRSCDACHEPLEPDAAPQSKYCKRPDCIRERRYNYQHNRFKPEIISEPGSQASEIPAPKDQEPASPEPASAPFRDD